MGGKKCNLAGESHPHVQAICQQLTAPQELSLFSFPPAYAKVVCMDIGRVGCKTHHLTPQKRTKDRAPVLLIPWESKTIKRMVFTGTEGPSFTSAGQHRSTYSLWTSRVSTYGVSGLDLQPYFATNNRISKRNA